MIRPKKKVKIKREAQLSVLLKVLQGLFANFFNAKRLHVKRDDVRHCWARLAILFVCRFEFERAVLEQTARVYGSRLLKDATRVEHVQIHRVVVAVGRRVQNRLISAADYHFFLANLRALARSTVGGNVWICGQTWAGRIYLQRFSLLSFYGKIKKKNIQKCVIE